MPTLQLRNSAARTRNDAANVRADSAANLVPLPDAGEYWWRPDGMNADGTITNAGTAGSAGDLVANTGTPVRQATGGAGGYSCIFLDSAASLKTASNLSISGQTPRLLVAVFSTTTNANAPIIYWGAIAAQGQAYCLWESTSANAFVINTFGANFSTLGITTTSAVISVSRGSQITGPPAAWQVFGQDRTTAETSTSPVVNTTASPLLVGAGPSGYGVRASGHNLKFTEGYLTSTIPNAAGLNRLLNYFRAKYPNAAF